jgi:hypothetical protein
MLARHIQEHRLAWLNFATIGWSACLATGIVLLLPRRQ